MKFAFSTLVGLLVLGVQSQAAVLYSCVNEARSSMAFSLELNRDSVNVGFSEDIVDGYGISLKGKSVNLPFKYSSYGYIRFAKMISVSSQERQFVELTMKESDFQNGPVIRVNMNISDKTFLSSSSALMVNQYGMTCHAL